MNLTRQGVRNLNGPAMNGRGHNGKKPSCPHFRNPHLPTRRERKVGYETRDGQTVEVARDVYVCAYCGEERFTKAER